MLYKNVPDRRKYRNSGREDGGGACIAALNRQEKRQLREQYEHAIKKDVFATPVGRNTSEASGA